MESIEQPITFDSLQQAEQENFETADKAGLIKESRSGAKRISNGESPGAESSPLHQRNTHNSIWHGPQNQGLRVIIISSIVFAVAVTIALILSIYLEPNEVHGHAAVSSADPRCSQMGIDTLKKGGNAIDALVSTAFCLDVVDPTHSGLGGGGFAVVHDHKYLKSSGYNFRENSPKNLKVEDLVNLKENAAFSMLSTGVPGQLKGLAKMHSDLGKLSWKDLIAPAIELAENGFTLSEQVYSVLKKVGVKNLDANLQKVFVNNKSGLLKKVNEIITRTDLSKTLRAIQTNHDALYSGALAEDFVAEISSRGGKITKEDMDNYSVLKPSNVVSSTLKDLTVIGMPLPSGGPILALMLNMVDQLKWKKSEVNDTLTYHQLIETMKFAFGQINGLGDPNFDASLNGKTQKLISKSLATELVGKINNVSHEQAYYGQAVMAEDHGTSHISIVDSSELMVAATLSLNYELGNRQMLDSGIILNNELLDFSIDGLSTPPINPGNKLEPGKRPLSSMCPTIVFSKDHPCNKRLVIGGTNATRILTGVAQVIVNTVVFDISLSDAIELERLHNSLHPDVTEYEDGFNSDIVAELVDVYKQNMKVAEPLGSVEAVEKVNDDIWVKGDSRINAGTAQF